MALIKKRSVRLDLKRGALLYLLLFLPVIYFIIFKYIPMYGVIIAFKEYNIFEGIMNSPWVGFKYFKEIFTMTEFQRALRNTLMLNSLDLFFSFPAPIILALLLNEIQINWFKRTSQTLLYLPYFLSWVIIGGIVYQLLSTHNGIINIIIKSIGLKPIPFLTTKALWIGTYVSVGVWQSAGWGTIIYLAAIAGVNPELYEAARVDGAGKLQQIWHVTLPCIRQTIVILLIMNLGKILMIGFERPFTIGNSYVVDYSDVISTFVYRVGLQSFQFSLATAVGLFQSAIGMIFLLAANYLAEKFGEEGIF